MELGNWLGRWSVAAVRALSALSLVAALIPAGEVSAAAVTGIRNTKHNLGTGGLAGNNQFSGTDEVCVFCHTPHGASTGAGNPPLWNRNLPATNIYTTYSSSTMDAAQAIDGVGNGAIGSVSIACLTCHDGTQAMNSIINAPGSGLTNSTFTNGTWTAGTNPTPVNPATGRLGSGIANLDVNLSNDHPIGIAYCGGGYTTASATGTCADSDFNAPASAVLGSGRVFWVETGVNAQRNKTDLVLYNRNFGGANPGPSVECASCHDPHTDAQPTFLRISNAQSAVCLSCHVK